MSPRVVIWEKQFSLKRMFSTAEILKWGRNVNDVKGELRR